MRQEGSRLRYGNGLLEVTVPGAGYSPEEAGLPEAGPQETFGLHLASGGELAAAYLAGGKRPCAVLSECVASGPVLHEQRITFEWESGGRYSILIRLAAEMPFVELEEEMEAAAGARLDIAWKGLRPTRRYTRNRGEEPIDAYLGERGRAAVSPVALRQLCLLEPGAVRRVCRRRQGPDGRSVPGRSDEMGRRGICVVEILGYAGGLLPVRERFRYGGR
ncbi:hypothetical protein [Cohnella rhizosphaerae]|uniref:Uncharacterized protein n=1 Tax=Cohnella rhizosphaerae TaxID=1457232 RepID=A0A9X4QWS9_9BACL|nr:hypothetical protein [Cohnella rhizosphaerae]MDG0813868.1 hypothetical protein [Cohnella rhizosphaerae]